jgi:transcription elongation GreA/GreB family factor
VKHPESKGTYLAAIECDGASYHSAASVRDRDRIRQEILESLGWKGRIWRIWSTDWFRSPRQESEKLISFLEDLRKTWKPEYMSGDSWVEEGIISETVQQETPERDSRLTPQEEIVFQSTENERKELISALIKGEDDIEVEVGDTVKYLDINCPQISEVFKVTQNTTDFENGIISKNTPLAQTLLGAVVGDEVTLNLAGKTPRIFRITEIKKSADS